MIVSSKWKDKCRLKTFFFKKIMPLLIKIEVYNTFELALAVGEDWNSNLEVKKNLYGIENYFKESSVCFLTNKERLLLFNTV